jgi:hypothetical protein
MLCQKKKLFFSSKNTCSRLYNDKKIQKLNFYKILLQYKPLLWKNAILLCLGCTVEVNFDFFVHDLNQGSSVCTLLKFIHKKQTSFSYYFFMFCLEKILLIYCVLGTRQSTILISLYQMFSKSPILYQSRSTNFHYQAIVRLLPSSSKTKIYLCLSLFLVGNIKYHKLGADGVQIKVL